MSIYLNDFYRKYPFSTDNQLWENYLFREKNSTFKELIKNKQKIIQICRNRWTEGILIFYIKKYKNEVELNQGEVPDISLAKNFNDLDEAWIKARKELLLLFLKKAHLEK